MAIQKAAVIGAGLMGGGIAAHIANAGHDVVLLDIVPEGAKDRNVLAEGSVARMLKTDPAPFMAKSDAKRIATGNVEDHLNLLGDADWIVEAVIEKVEAKQAIYRKIDSVRKAGSIVSSNTSTIPSSVLLDGLPEEFARDFLITHFFNPPRYMRLLEVVAGPETRADAVADVCDFADRKLGKGVVPCNDTPGFIANRIGTYWLVAAVRAAVQRLEGAYAIGVICRDEPGRMVGARLGSPLVIGVGIEENFIASDVLALRPVTDRFIFLEEGDLVDIRSDSIGVWSAANETVVRATVRVEHVFDEVDKGNYRHHMQREIHEQPRVVRDTLEGRLGRTRVLEPAFGVRAPRVLDDTDAVTLVACGTAYYAACIGRHWIEQYVGIPAQAEIASEWRYRSVSALPGSLFLTLSQSGETADTLAALRIAKQAGFAHTATVCNVPMSSLVRESDMAIMLEAGAEIGVASTKAFTAMLADLLMWTILLGRRRGMTQEREAELVGALHGLSDAVDEVLRLDDRLRLLAEEFVERRHALFLGRGPHFPVALEGALKLKEISYVHAEGYPAGELKHGPLALVTDEMPVVAVAPNNDLFEKTRSNLQEVRARGGRLYVFADSETGFEEAPGVDVIEVPRVHEAIAPIVYTVPLQLLAYHVAVLKGTDVDQPRNLAKSVTVE